MLNLYKIEYIDEDYISQVAVVVSKSMVNAIQCFEKKIDRQVTKCEILTGYNTVLVDE